MRRIVLALLGTVSGLVLLFSYHTSTNSRTASPSAAGPTPATTPSTSSATSSSSATPTASATPSTTSSGSSSGTYTGSVAQTRWGPVQVQITVANGKITAAQAVQYPQTNPRDEEINAYAVPTLNQETVQQQSGKIDVVSGATVTSEGYIQSLQSALDQAHL